MTVVDLLPGIAVGAGLASMMWSCLAWRETFGWMKLVDRCISNMERMKQEIDLLRAFINLENGHGMTLDEFFAQCRGSEPHAVGEQDAAAHEEQR